MASAPASTAISASSTLVMPQILMRVMPASSSAARASRDQRRQAVAGIGLGHEALADQERAVAGVRAAPPRSAPVRRPLSATRTRADGDDRRHAMRGLDRHRERLQVAVVDADDGRRRRPWRAALRPRRALRSARRCRRLRRVASRRTSAGCSSAATISSTADAPASAASAIWYSSTMKSLRSNGIAGMRRTDGDQVVERAVEERRARSGPRSRPRRPSAYCAGDRHRVVLRPQHAAATATGACIRR